MSDAMIEESAARLFSQNVDRALLERFERGEFPRRLWDLVAENGLPLALATEEAGGIGASWADAWPILRGAGYWSVPLPLASTMIAALMLSKAGQSVPDGPVALIDEEAGAGLRLAGGALHGAVRRVAWARHCPHALAAVGGELVLVALAGKAALTERLNPAREPDDAVAFDGAPLLAQFDNPFASLHKPLRAFGALATSAMMVGAMEWLLEQSVQYATDRVQFGRPIGRNQAIQQNLAQMAGDIGSARMAAAIACEDAPHAGAVDRPNALFSIAVAKVRAGEAGTRAAAISHQVHGAIGFTYEHMLNYATRRLLSWREAHGSDGEWAIRLGEAAIAARAGGFWTSLTARQFEGLHA